MLMKRERSTQVNLDRPGYALTAYELESMLGEPFFDQDNPSNAPLSPIPIPILIKHRIYVLAKGQIVQQGTFAELIQIGLFARLMARQY